MVEEFGIFAWNFTTQLTFFDQACLEHGKRQDPLHLEIGDQLWPHREVCPQISNSLQPQINFLNALKPRKKIDRSLLRNLKTGFTTWSYHLVLPPDLTTRSYHPVLSPGLTTRSYHPVLPPSLTTRSYHLVLPSGLTTRSYHPVLPPGLTNWSYHLVLPPGLAIWSYHLNK